MIHPIRFLLSSLLLMILGLIATSPARSQDYPNAVSLSPQQVDQLRDLAGRVLQHTDKAGCRKKDCTILVANFTGPSGSTSVLGMQLADALSSQLVAQTNGVRIVDHGSLQRFLEKERIPSQLLKDDRDAAWLASELSASTILVGSLTKESSGVRVQVRLLNAKEALEKEKNKKVKAPIEELVLPIQDPDSALSPAEPFASESHPDSTSPGEGVFRAGANGVTMPTCFYRPVPIYTEAARSANYSGSVLVEVTIFLNGRIGAVDVVRGASYGMNEAVREAVATWKCKPASFGGAPVVTRVPIEVSFHLF